VRVGRLVRVQKMRSKWKETTPVSYVGNLRAPISRHVLENDFINEVTSKDGYLRTRKSSDYRGFSVRLGRAGPLGLFEPRPP